MNRIIILSLVAVSVIITGCKLTRNKHEIKEILRAEKRNDFHNPNIELSLFDDNTYLLIETGTFRSIYEKKYTGSYAIKNDSLNFTDSNPLKLDKARIINNILDFGTEDRLTISKTSLKLPHQFDYKKHSDFALFTFNPAYEIFSGFDQNSKPYDLTEEDILAIIKIFNSCSTYRGAVKSNKYWKQCMAVINPQGEKEVWINCLCKKYNNNSENFQYRIISVDDGGPCYMGMKINLTKHQCYDVHFNGHA